MYLRKAVKFFSLISYYLKISARTSYIPPEDPAKRSQRYVNKTGKTPGQTGNIPLEGTSPSPNAPLASQKPSSVILPTRPARPGSQSLINTTPSNTPTVYGSGSKPPKQPTSGNVPPLVPIQGKLIGDSSSSRTSSRKASK